jgi:hypothetical protein
MDLSKILAARTSGKRSGNDPERPPEPPPAALSGGALVINCSQCRYAPDPGTAECIRCMVSTMCTVGSSDRIVLRTGKDLEISGHSGKVVKDTASVMRWSFPQEPEKGRCRMCEMSRRKVMDEVWRSFPDDAMASAEARLQGKRPQGKDCDMCVLRTRRALEQIDMGLKEISERMTDIAGRPLP